MTPKQIKTSLVDKREADSYWKRSRELVVSMRNNLILENWNAAVIDGVHAVISANDALTVAAIGKRSASDHHLDAADLLNQAIAAEMKPDISRLKRILHIKSHVEYGPSLVRAPQARQVSLDVERFCEWAEKVFQKLK